MRISFTGPVARPSGTIAVGLWRGRKPTSAFAALDPDGRFAKTLKRVGFDGDDEETELFLAPQPPLERLVVFGLGKPRKLDAARLRRIGVTHTAVLEAKVVAWVPLATLCGRLNDELRARDESDHLAYFLMSDLNDPLNEYYVYDNGNYELRHRTTVELQAESDEIHEEIQTLADFFGFDERYDSEDPDFADGSLALARCRVWAGL